MAQPSFSSNNPFRRKAAAPSAPAAPPVAVPPLDGIDGPSPTPDDAPALAPSGDRFRDQFQALSHPSQPPPTTSFQKPKVVKHVRVQSPPPPSPDSPGISDRFSPVRLDDGESSSSDDTDEQLDPFSYTSSTGSADASDRDELQAIPSHRPPPNPFQKTLKDLEVGAAGAEQSFTAGAGKVGLDVGAFGRLLMTGQAAPYTQHTKYPPTATGNGITADTPAVRQSLPDTLQAVQNTPQTSTEASEQETEHDGRRLLSSPPVSQPAAPVPKKKPPPPSSRHGKLINPRAGNETKDAAGGPQQPLASPTRRAATMPPLSPSAQRPATPSDVNKPLPAAPHRSPAEEEAESVFDREAAGKVPEPEIHPGLNIIMPPRPPTPPNASHAVISPTPTAQPTKKPAPPPRRQPHGRSESRAASSASSTVQHDETDSSLRRSSLDSTRSRSSSLRVSIHAPAPPPPRRPSHTPRAASSHSLPLSSTSPGDIASSSPADPSPSPLSVPLAASPPPLGDSSNSSNSTPGTATPTPLPAAAAPSSASTVTLPTISTATGKLVPPPPPPARNASVRAKKRPVSGSNLSSTSLPSPTSNNNAGLVRKSSKGKEPPPPPRHRDRGDSKVGSVPDGVGAASASVTGPAAGPAPEYGVIAGGAGNPEPESEGVTAGSGDTEETRARGSSAAGDILADLTALQREVDALRGRYEKGGEGV